MGSIKRRRWWSVRHWKAHHGGSGGQSVGVPQRGWVLFLSSFSAGYFEPSNDTTEVKAHLDLVLAAAFVQHGHRREFGPGEQHATLWSNVPRFRYFPPLIIGCFRIIFVPAPLRSSGVASGRLHSQNGIILNVDGRMLDWRKLVWAYSLRNSRYTERMQMWWLVV